MTIYGWDMSHYDAPDIGSAVSDGIVFITHKAGGDANDAELGAWWSGVRGLDPARVLLGAYWVLYPGNPAYRANLFLSRLDSQCPGWRDRPFILQVDCEKWGGDAGTVPSKAEIKAFCDELRSKMPKLMPIVYAPEWVYGDQLSGLGYPLWASRYVSGTGSFRSLYPGDSSSRWSAYSGQVPAILQYTSSATIAGQSTSDANAYRGTLEQLTALVAPGWSEEMALDGTDAKTVWGTDGCVTMPDWHPDKTANPNITGGYAMYIALNEAHAANAAAAALKSQLTSATNTLLSAVNAAASGDSARDANLLSTLLAAVNAQTGVDAGAVAEALVAPLAAAITANIPAGSTALTFDDVEQAVRNVLVHGTDGA